MLLRFTELQLDIPMNNYSGERNYLWKKKMPSKTLNANSDLKRVYDSMMWRQWWKSYGDKISDLVASIQGGLIKAAGIK